MKTPTPRIRDDYEFHEFEEILEKAEANAKTAWETSFVSDIRSRWDSFGVDMFLSGKQHSQLLKIIGESI